MIVAHDKSLQRLPSPKRIGFHSVLFGPSGAGGGEPAAKSDAGYSVSFTPPGVIPHDEEHARLLAEAKLIRDIDNVKDFQSLVPVAHEMAVAKGWWQDGIDKRSIDEIVANYHAEVSEAWEEYRAGRMATWYAAGSAKPEGFWIEIADLLIRIADAEGSCSDMSNGDRPHQLRLEHSPRSERVHYINGRKSKFAAFICELNVEVCAECVEHSPVTLCEEFAKSNNVNLYAAVREKLRYNATRPYRHGGKLA